MAISKMDVQNMRLEINKALEEVGKKYGVKLQAGNARFTPTTVKFSLEGGLADGESEDSAYELAVFKMNANRYGMPTDALDTPIKIMGHAGYRITVKAVGMRVSAKRYPIIVKSINTNTRYKISVDQFKRSYREAKGI